MSAEREARDEDDLYVAGELLGWYQRVQEAVFYARATARSCGYALAVHGSLRRDIDVIAVPWTEDAVEPRALAHAILDHLMRCEIALGWAGGGPEGTAKPHGRHAWDISLAGSPFCYLDLSVMSSESAIETRVRAEEQEKCAKLRQRDMEIGRARVRAETDAEWRARVEGAKKQIEDEALCVKNDDPNHDGADHECNYCVDGSAVMRSLSALDALLTAVARDREG